MGPAGLSPFRHTAAPLHSSECLKEAKVITSPETQWEPPQAQPAPDVNHLDKNTYRENTLCYRKTEASSFKHPNVWQNRSLWGM